MHLFRAAADFPAVRILQQHSVTRKDIRIVARPAYIFTDTKLAEPTTFTAVQSFSESLDPACCLKFAIDPEFSSHIKAVKGYQYIYAAEPTRDRRLWTPLIEAVMKSAIYPEDASPFSTLVIAATFIQKSVPTTFSIQGTQLSLAARYDKNSDRLSYTFLRNKKMIELSEAIFPH